MNYSFCKKFPQRVRELDLSAEIVVHALSQVPEGPATERLEELLDEAGNYDWELVVDDQKADIWVCAVRDFARHCFKFPQPSHPNAMRLVTLLDFVESWD